MWSSRAVARSIAKMRLQIYMPPASSVSVGHVPLAQNLRRDIPASYHDEAIRNRGLAGASHYTRNHRDESVEIFAQWVPNTDVAVGKKAIRHISYDPRLSPAVMRAFESAEDEVLINTLKGAPRLEIPDQFSPAKVYPEYFADLPPLK